MPPSRRELPCHRPDHDRVVERAHSDGRRASLPPCHSVSAKAERGPTSDRERLRAIREWARANGYPELGNRGRIPQHIVAEYEAAHRG
ncbi:MAG: Lsr2 family protein [Actinobacteria bacterium]|nr:Lsr2 family protein [Actinomycetota bacterium]